MLFISASIISCGETNNKKPNERSVKYSNTGFTKYNLKDYKGAISDYTKSIVLDPVSSPIFSQVYNNGICCR